MSGMNQNQAGLQIYVGNLSYDSTEQDLNAHFGQYGEIAIAKVVKDRETGRSRGFGFVTFKTEAAAKGSLASNGFDLQGKQLRVNLAHEDTRRSGGGAGGAGAGRPPRTGGGGYRSGSGTGDRGGYRSGGGSDDRGDRGGRF
jgi:RNA recognition motif-containing protein